LLLLGVQQTCGKKYIIKKLYNLERICVGFKAITCKFHLYPKKEKKCTLGFQCKLHLYPEKKGKNPSLLNNNPQL
jgi:hypothetical protein